VFATRRPKLGSKPHLLLGRASTHRWSKHSRNALASPRRGGVDHECDATKQKLCRNDEYPNRATSSQAVAERGLPRVTTLRPKVPSNLFCATRCGGAELATGAESSGTTLCCGWSGHFGPRILSLPSEGFYGLAHRCTSSSLTWCKFPEASCAYTVFAAKQRPRLASYSCWQPLPPQKLVAGGVIVMRSATAELHACMATVPTLHRDPHRVFPVAPYYWRRPDHRAEAPPWTRPLTQACKAFWKARSQAPAARHCWGRAARSMVTDRVGPDTCAGRRTPKRILRDSRRHLRTQLVIRDGCRANPRGHKGTLCVTSQQSSCFCARIWWAAAGKDLAYDVSTRLFPQRASLGCEARESVRRAREDRP